MGSSPRISVGMPVYNGEKYIRSAVESILTQTFDDFELIISDNASTDRTREICKDLAREDGRILFLRSPENLGAAENYRIVFSHARAPYFRWANADDISGPKLHECCLAALEQRPDAVLAYGGTVIIDANGDFLSEYSDNLDLQQERPSQRLRAFYDRVGLTNVVYGLMRTDAMRKGPLMGDGTLPAPDVLFMAILALQGKFVELTPQLFFRRIHDLASSRDRANQELQQEHWSAGKRNFVKPHWRSHQVLLGAVARLDVGLPEKRRLIAYVFRRMYWCRREILRELSGRGE